MPLPEPKPGLVVHTRFPWRHEHEAGQDEGEKDRPCVVVIAVVEATGGRKIVYVAPITHREPARRDDGLEIQPRLKLALGLDEDRSWIIARAEPVRLARCRSKAHPRTSRPIRLWRAARPLFRTAEADDPCPRLRPPRHAALALRPILITSGLWLRSESRRHEMTPLAGRQSAPRPVI